MQDTLDNIIRLKRKRLIDFTGAAKIENDSKKSKDFDENDSENNSFINPEDISNTTQINHEDSSAFLQNFYDGKNLILNETWDYSENIHARIAIIKKDIICVDCIIDQENLMIETREFPILLFKGLKNLKEGKLVIIKTLMKKGTFKLDVYSGESIVNETLFENDDDFKFLENKNLDNTLTEW